MGKSKRQPYKKGYLWKRLRELQKKHSDPWTVAGVAKRAEISVSYLYRLLQGTATASPEIAKRLSKILGIPLDVIPMHRGPGRPPRR